MKGNCLDIGLIQAFMDGELAHDETNRVSGHIAACNACALMLAEAEDSSALVLSVLERELNTMVPTQRLWYRISESISTAKAQAPLWEKAWRFLRIALASPAIAVAASFILVVAIVAAIWVKRSPDSDNAAAKSPASITVSDPGTRTPSSDDPGPAVQLPVRGERAAFRPSEQRAISSPASYIKQGPTATSNGYMPGEESYIKTISSLTNTVNVQKDTVMRPSERIAYESDMAVVDDAIRKMRTEIKRNPKNESARQVLYASYQNKIDLLNSVSQKQELMASLR